jgi:multicomponent Na+:H+ antiporter subunit D
MIFLTLIFEYLFVGSLNIIVKRSKWLWIVNSIANFIVIVLVENQLPIHYFPGKWPPPFGIEILANQSSYTFFILFSIIYPLVNFYASFYEKNTKYFYGFVNFLAASFINLIITNDLFNIFVSFELFSLISFILTGLKKDGRSTIAALRYMVVSTVAMNFYLLGFIMIYSQTGTLSLTELSHTLKYNSFTLIGFSFIISGLLAKAGLALYSMWLPLVHSSSKTSVSALLSSIIVEVPIFIICKFSITFPILHNKISLFLLIIGIGSAIFGAIMATLSKNAKVTLSYSTISQSGIMFTGIALGNFYVIPYYILYHGISKASMFLASGEISKYEGVEYANYKNTPSIFPLIMILNAIALTGVPFFGIAYQKEMLIKNFYLVAIFSLFTSLYATKFIKPIKLKKPMFLKDFLLLIPTIFIFSVKLPHNFIIETTIIILSIIFGRFIKIHKDIEKEQFFTIESNLMYFIYLTTILTILIVR